MAMNAKEFRAALEMIEAQKGIKPEVVIKTLHESIEKGFKKHLGGEDAQVEVVVDLEKGISMCQLKKVVDDVQDDLLEIELDEAKAYDKNAKVGDTIRIPTAIEDLRKAVAMSIKSIWKQKYSEAEKDAVKEIFEDKLGTMQTGRVERCDEKGAHLYIGRNSVFLPRNRMIGDERFSTGDTIRVFIDGIENASNGNGARVCISRTSEGFLKSLFNEEIREIYDGTIEIKSVAREAGEKSKVAVYSSNPDVDPAGSCIGPNGSRIQKIVSQLGNGNVNKEKIDIIAWSENPGLYIMESLKPARIAGIVYNEETKTATAVIENDSLTSAIGRRGVNVRLAAKLTNYKIDVKTKSDALEAGLNYLTFEELNAIQLAKREQAKLEAREAQLQAMKSAQETLPGMLEGYVAPDQRVYEEEKNDFDEVFESKVENETIEVPAAKKEEVKAPEAPAATPVVEEKPVEEVEVKAVKTTTTLSDLENSLEAASKKNSQKGNRKSWNKKKSKEEEEEESVTISHDPSQNMSIYTEEELREMEAEELEDNYEDDDDVDYDEYDEYYDDEN